MPPRTIKIFALLFFTVPVLLCRAQAFQEEQRHGALRLGIHLAWGTHVQRLGVQAGLYLWRGHFQSNTEIRVHFSRRAFGPPLRYGEAVISQGFAGAAGPQTQYDQNFFSPVSNQTGFVHSLAYAWNIYLNRAGTTQRTGVLAVRSGSFALITENDILAQPGADRYRTGAVLLQYSASEYVQCAVNCMAWTGAFGRKQFLPDSSWCYMSVQGGRYTHYSHGVLAVQARVSPFAGGDILMSVGGDAEQVRDFLQNKLLHSLFSRKNCYMPTLDSSGNAWIPGSAAPRKAARPFWEVQSNAPVFY